MPNTCKSNGSVMVAILWQDSGKRVSNVQVIYLREGNNPAKAGLMSHKTTGTKVPEVNSWSNPAPSDEPVSYQLVGGVKAHQDYDG